MIQTDKKQFILILIIVVSIILSNFFDWSTSIFVAVAIVLAIPPFLNMFYFLPKKLKNLPDVDAMPDEILKLEEEIIRDEEFISQLDNSEFRSLREIVTEIIETLSLNTNH